MDRWSCIIIMIIVTSSKYQVDHLMVRAKLAPCVAVSLTPRGRAVVVYVLLIDGRQIITDLLKCQ